MQRGRRYPQLRRPDLCPDMTYHLRAPEHLKVQSSWGLVPSGSFTSDFVAASIDDTVGSITYAGTTIVGPRTYTWSIVQMINFTTPYCTVRCTQVDDLGNGAWGDFHTGMLIQPWVSPSGSFALDPTLHPIGSGIGTTWGWTFYPKMYF